MRLPIKIPIKGDLILNSVISAKILMSVVRRMHIVLLAVAAGMVWNNQYNILLGSPFQGSYLGWLLLVIYIVLFCLFFQLYGAYRIGDQKVNMIVYSNWLSMFMTNVIICCILFLIGRGSLPIAPIIMLTFVDAVIIFIWGHLANKIYFKLFPPRKVVCFYEGDYPAMLVKELNGLKKKFNLTGVYAFDQCGDIEATAQGAQALIFYHLSEEKSAKLMKFCMMKRLRYYLFPTIGDVLLKTSETIFLFDMPLFLARNEGLTLRQKFCKRIFDLISSAIMIVILSPVMLIAALLIKLEDGGPVIYKQIRCTENGREFEIFKFRSMVMNAESKGGPMLASKNDPRITKIGHYIRKFRIDELPQLFNILLGDMSLVGPRPERPDFIKQYSEDLPEFICRMNVKCGLTGYAQVMGRYDTSPEDKLKLDLMYIQMYSIFFDIKILLMTVKIVLFDSKNNSD